MNDEAEIIQSMQENQIDCDVLKLSDKDKPVFSEELKIKDIP